MSIYIEQPVKNVVTLVSLLKGLFLVAAVSVRFIVSFWCMWTSRCVMNALKICTLIWTFITRPLVHIHQRKKIAPKLAAKNCKCKGHVTPCNFSCNLQCNSTLERCQLVKSVKNFRYVEKTSAECNEDSYLVILHLSRVELHCKLQEKLHRVTWP
jgi:hypothetical protein